MQKQKAPFKIVYLSTPLALFLIFGIIAIGDNEAKGISFINFLKKFLGGIMVVGKKVKIRIKDTEDVRCCQELKKFAGRVVLGTLLTTGIYFFTFNASTGLTGPVKEPHTIAPHLVDVLQ